MRLAATIVVAIRGLLVAGRLAEAQKAYGPGVTDSEIKLHQTMPFSGPASAYGLVGRSGTAYFKMINDGGGLNGRKILRPVQTRNDRRTAIGSQRCRRCTFSTRIESDGNRICVHLRRDWCRRGSGWPDAGHPS
jgi:hypothetical protein